MQHLKSRSHFLAISTCVVLVTAVAGSAARGSTAGRMFNGRLHAVGGQSATVVSADLDSDGVDDLVVTGPDEPLAVLLTGDGAFAEPVLYEAAGIGAAAVGDFNGDAALDLVITRHPDTVAVLPGVGGGAFASALPSTSLGADPAAVAVSDFDGDGLDDLAITTHGDDKGETALLVLLNGGGGTFARPNRLALWKDGPVDDHDYAPPVVTGDFNDDGHPDLTAARFGGGGVSLFLGAGDGAFTRGSSYEIDDPVTAMATGDFDADGTADLAVATVPWLNESDPGTVQVMLGKGDGTLSSPRVHPLLAAPYSIVVADLDRNGAADLTVANPYDETVAVLLGTGEGAFRAPRHHPAGRWPLSVVAGDLDGDAAPDLIAASDEGVWLLRNLLRPAR